LYALPAQKGRQLMFKPGEVTKVKLSSRLLSAHKLRQPLDEKSFQICECKLRSVFKHMAELRTSLLGISITIHSHIFLATPSASGSRDNTTPARVSFPLGTKTKLLSLYAAYKPFSANIENNS
jgi:hypothetical protein